MILVTGATGQLGAAVVRQLLARTDASRIAVLVRDRGRAAGLERQGYLSGSAITATPARSPARWT